MASSFAWPSCLWMGYIKKAGPCQVTMPLGQIAAAACLSTPLKLNASVVGSYCKFACQMASEGKLYLVDKHLAFWSAPVDPSQLCIPKFFLRGNVQASSLATRILMRMYMAMAM